MELCGHGYSYRYPDVRGGQRSIRRHGDYFLYADHRLLENDDGNSESIAYHNRAYGRVCRGGNDRERKSGRGHME